MTERLDYEAELALVVGAITRNVDEDKDMGNILGFTIANDVSARDWQFDEDNQLTLGKGFDTFFPLGSWVVTVAEFGDPHSHRIRCIVNGDVRQDASNGDMVFGVGANLLIPIVYLHPQSR